MSSVEPRSVIAAGGAGFLGRIVVADLVGAGATVAVPTRRPDEVRAFAASLAPGPGRVVVVALDGDDPYRRAQDAIRRALPDASAVVASIGGWWLGPSLLDVALDVWQRALDDHLTAHLLAIRAYAPLIVEAPDPVYVTTNGVAADRPLAGSGPISVTGAAQRMLLEVMRAEPVGERVRFHEVTFRAAVAGDARNLAPDGELTPAEVAAAVLAVLDDPGAASLVGVDPVASTDPGPADPVDRPTV
jgi:NADP-dependent 3-hydroxy acid dehydrogenase YdfG